MSRYRLVLVAILSSFVACVSAIGPPSCTNFPGCYVGSDGVTCICVNNCAVAALGQNCTLCNPGFQLLGNGNCQQCQANFINDGTKTACTACAASCFSFAGTDSCTCFTNCQQGSPSGCAICNPGFRNNEGLCFACPEGSTSPDGITCVPCAADTFDSEGVCVPCTQGQSTNGVVGALSCCLAGTAPDPNNVGNCIPCLAGTYSFALAEQCSPCPEGWVSGSNAAQCIPCPMNSYANVQATSCQGCNSNCFSLEASTTCTCCLSSCNVNSTQSGCACCSVAECAICIDDATCGICNPGFVLLNEQCVLCTLAHCLQCSSSGGYCDRCVSGFAPVGGFCQPCPPGSITSFDGTTCTQCPPNTFQQGLECVACPFVASPTSSSSSALEQLNTGGLSGATSCCPGGTTYDASSQTCRVCAINHYAAPYTAQCLICPIGEGCTLIGVSPNAIGCNCTSDSCQAGTYPAETSYVSGSGPSPGQCIPCQAGTFSNHGDLACQPCPANTFSTQGAFTCYPCPPGTMSSAGEPFCWSVSDQLQTEQLINAALNKRLQVLEGQMQNLIQLLFGEAVADSAAVNETTVFTDNWATQENAASFSSVASVPVAELIIDFQIAASIQTSQVTLLQQFDQSVSKILVGTEPNGQVIMDPVVLMNTWGQTPSVLAAIELLDAEDYNITREEHIVTPCFCINNNTGLPSGSQGSSFNLTTVVNYLNTAIHTAVGKLRSETWHQINNERRYLENLTVNALSKITTGSTGRQLGVHDFSQLLTLLNQQQIPSISSLATTDSLMTISLQQLSASVNALTSEQASLVTNQRAQRSFVRTLVHSLWPVLWRIFYGPLSVPPALNIDGSLPTAALLLDSAWMEGLNGLTTSWLNFTDQLGNITAILVGDAIVPQEDGLDAFWVAETTGDGSANPLTLLSIAQTSEKAAAAAVEALTEKTLASLYLILYGGYEPGVIGRRLLTVGTIPPNLNFTNLFTGPFTPLAPLGAAVTEISVHITQDDATIATLTQQVATDQQTIQSEQQQLDGLQSSVDELQNSGNPTFTSNLKFFIYFAFGVAVVALLVAILVAVGLGCLNRKVSDGEEGHPLTKRTEKETQSKFSDVFKFQ